MLLCHELVLAFLVSTLLCGSSSFSPSSSSPYAPCPVESVLYPCGCHHHERIECVQPLSYHLARVFSSLVSSVRASHVRPLYRELYLSNPMLTQLDDRFLAATRFERIVLDDMKTLERIMSSAFEGTEKDVVFFAIKGENLLNQTYVNQLFDSLSSLRHAREMHLSLPRLCFLPNFAFRAPASRSTINLERLVLHSRCLVSIPSYAFYELSHLRHLTLSSDIGLEHLSAHAFDISSPPNAALRLDALTIDLRSNQLTEFAFEPDAFGRVSERRAVRLQLGDNNLTHLRAEHLKAFLDASQENVVHLQGNRLECDCSMAWLLRSRSVYIAQVHNAICSGLVDLWMLNAHDYGECNHTTHPAHPSPRFIFANSGVAPLLARPVIVLHILTLCSVLLLTFSCAFLYSLRTCWQSCQQHR